MGGFYWWKGEGKLLEMFGYMQSRTINLFKWVYSG